MFLLFHLFRVLFNLTSKESECVLVHEGGSRVQLVTLSGENVYVSFSAPAVLCDLRGCFYGYNNDGTNLYGNSSIQN